MKDERAIPRCTADDQSFALFVARTGGTELFICFCKITRCESDEECHSIVNPDPENESCSLDYCTTIPLNVN
jgi:hypothetical protein